MTPSHRTLLAGAVGLSLLGGLPVATAIPLQNGAFTPDFSGWDGETIDLVNGTVSVDPETSPRFTILRSGRAELTTDPSGDNTYHVGLYQQFDLPSETTSIAFDLGWALTDYAGGELAEVILTNVFNTLDSALLAEATSDTSATSAYVVDISSFAGKTVELLFFVEDIDDQQDSLTLGNIQINTQDAPTPAPLALLGTGALAFRLTQRRRG